jgi:tetratricopeptide (TPR) repeat protein
MGDVEGSLSDFNKVTALAPESSEALELRAMSLQRLDRHDEAIRDVTKAIQMRRFEPHLLNSRAYTRAIAGVELNEALQDIQSAIESEGRNSHYLDTRGYIYFLLGEYEPALADLDQALAMARREAPNTFILDRHPYPERVLARLKRQHENILAVMYHHRGEIHQKLGHSEQAESDLRQGDAFGYNRAAGIY